MNTPKYIKVKGQVYRLADDTNPTANDSFDEAVKKRDELEYQYRNIVHWLRLHSSDSDDAYNEAEKKAKYIYTALENVQSEIEKYLLPNPFRSRRDFLRSPRSR